jgi:predicted RNA-binding Zn ribbon-like protein
LNAVEAIRNLRERLRKQVVGKERGGTVHRAMLDELNLLMAEHPMLTRLKLSGKSSTTELWFDPRQPEDLFAPLAHSAAMLLSGADGNRVRMCRQCVLHFCDTSKKGTRRWCSMQLCGNRIKVAAYAARQQVRARR